MATLIDFFGYLSVIIRGAVLVTQSFVIGGIAFLLLTRSVSRELGSDGERLEIRVRRFFFWSALAFTLAEIAFVAVQCAVLMGTVDLGLGDVLRADFALAGLALAGAGLVCIWVARPPVGRSAGLALGPPPILMLIAQATTSHAMARIDDRSPLLLAEVPHIAGAAGSVVALPHFPLALA